MIVNEDIAYKKIASIIFSCNTPNQVRSAIKMIDNYNRKYENHIGRNNLLNFVELQLLGLKLNNLKSYVSVKENKIR